MSCLAGELFIQDSLHDDIGLRGSESSCSSDVCRIGHAQVEHHLVAVMLTFDIGFCRTHRVPTLPWFSSPSSSSSPSRCKPIIDKQPHSSDFSIATHISYITGKRTLPGFIRRWQRQRQRHTQRQIRGQRQRQNTQEESLPVYISLGTLYSNKYI